MGHQIIRQPDGNWAIYSSEVDHFIIMDDDREGIVGFYVNKAIADTRKRINKLFDQLEAGENPYYQFALTWEEALENDKKNYGWTVD